MINSFDKLLEFNVYDGLNKKREELFLDSLNESYQHHYSTCEPYRKFCDRRGFNKGHIFKSIEEIPSMPVQAFKEYGTFLISSKNKQKDNLILQSSATSGRPSSISVDKLTARRQIQTMTRTLAQFLGDKRRPFLIMDIDPTRASPNILGARAAATRGFLNLAKDPIYLLFENEKGNLELDHELFKQALESFQKSKENPVIFGFTYVLYEALFSKQKEMDSIDIGESSSLIHIGGWKKLENQKVSKDKFNELINDFFGIRRENIFDIYGFTELMGIIYPSSDLEHKTTSIFADVLVRDPSTLEVVNDGEEGILEFISPMPYSYPGLAITTDDLGVITGFNNDPNQGFCGKKFEIIGRAKNAEVRGCGDIMSTYVEQKRISTNNDAIIQNPNLLFLGKATTRRDRYFSSLDLSSLPEVDSLSSVVSKVLEAREKLDDYSVDEIISYLSESSKVWLDTKDLAIFKQNGLSFLTNWLQSSNLRLMADQALNGQRGIIDSFAPDRLQPYRKIRTVPRGVVIHWLAGNVPLLGMLALVQSIITKNANILKAPSTNSGVLPALLDVMSETDITLSTGRRVIGKDITDSIAMLYYPRENINFANELSKKADLRIAWGGKEAIESVLSLPKKHTTEDVIFGPKLSYMVIGKEMLSKNTNIKKLLRRVATDSSVFDQYACASPHTIFIEKGGDISPKEFAELLSNEMEKAAVRIPKEPADAGTAGNINSIRMLYEFTKDIWSSTDTTWTVLYDEDAKLGLVEPTYSRVITIRAMDDILLAADFAHDDIQTISLGLSEERKIEFAEIAAKKGVARFPEIGRMTHFDSPWDGLFLMQRLVRDVSLGGPYL